MSDRSTYPLKVRHLIDLIASGIADPFKVVEKSYEWDHARRIEVAKWALTLSSSVAAALALSVLAFRQEGQNPLASPLVVYGVAVAAGLSMGIGIFFFWRARAVHHRLIFVSALVASLMTVQPFLKKLKSQGLL